MMRCSECRTDHPPDGETKFIDGKEIRYAARCEGGDGWVEV